MSQWPQRPNSPFLHVWSGAPSRWSTPGRWCRTGTTKVWAVRRVCWTATCKRLTRARYWSCRTSPVVAAVVKSCTARRCRSKWRAPAVRTTRRVGRTPTTSLENRISRTVSTTYLSKTGTFLPKIWYNWRGVMSKNNF